MQTYVNPFNPQTPVGASLQNIATAMFSNNMDRRALADERHQHADLYRIMGEKHLRDMQAADEQSRARSPAEMDRTVSYMTGQPIAAINSARGYLEGNMADGTMPPAEPVRRAIGRAYAALRTGSMDKTINAREIAQAYGDYGNMADREGIMEGTIDPTRAAQAHFATSGRAPFNNMGDKGTFNVITGGDQALNPVGTGAATAENALAAARNSLVRQRDARTDQIDDGTNVPLVPVLENGQLVYRPRQDAVGGTPGAIPRNAPTPAPRPRVALHKTEADAMTAAFNALQGGKGSTPEMKTELMSLATGLATDPSSPYFHNPIAAARSVWDQNSSRVQQPSDWRNIVPFVSNNLSMSTAPAVVPSSPTPAAGGNPPPKVAQQNVPMAPIQVGLRVKGTTYMTPRGPMTWTGTGWTMPSA